MKTEIESEMAKLIVISGEERQEFEARPSS